MNEHLAHETDALIRAWAHYDRAWLRDYLVAGVEDPRLNIQSLLTRHTLIRHLAPGRFEALMHEEIRFAVVLNWLLAVLNQPGGRADLESLIPALRRGSDNAEGFEVPTFVSQAFAAITTASIGVAIPNYLEAAIVRGPAEVMDTFLQLWARTLGSTTVSTPLRVLEPACGSANDYRFLHSCGIAPHLDYTGIDLCTANIANAQTLFPQVRFRVGNALALPFSDRFFELVYVHDLFEHLSLEALETSLDELSRVTQRTLCLGFFRVHEGPDHRVQPVDDYHVNTLSLPLLRAGLNARGYLTQAIHIDTFLRENFQGPGYHNPNAYTLIATRTAPCP